MVASPELVLRFVAGPYKGAEVALRPGREVRIGRSSDADLVLIDDQVSRRHASITCRDGDVTIEDLGSTNGTLVNGEKVGRARLARGDRVFIGESIIHLVEAPPASDSEDRGRPDSLNEPFPSAERTRRATECSGVASVSLQPSGKLADVPLCDLLVLFSSGKRSNTIRVEGAGLVGRVHLREGAVIHAEIDGPDPLPARKALVRMLAWTQGDYSVLPLEPRVPQGIEPGGAPLADAMREVEALRVMRHDLPRREEAVAVAFPLAPPLKDLPPIYLEVLQLAYNHRLVGDVIDRSGATDYQAWTALQSLLERGYLVRG